MRAPDLLCLGDLPGTPPQGGDETQRRRAHEHQRVRQPEGAHQGGEAFGGGGGQQRRRRAQHRHQPQHQGGGVPDSARGEGGETEDQGQHGDHRGQETPEPTDPAHPNQGPGGERGQPEVGQGVGGQEGRGDGGGQRHQLRTHIEAVPECGRIPGVFRPGRLRGGGGQRHGAGGVAGRQGEVVGDHDDCGAVAVQVRQQPHQRLGAPPVQAGGGFVEDQDVGVHRQGGGHRQSLPVPASEPQRMQPGEISRPHPFQGPAGPRRHLRVRQSRVARPEGGLVEDGVREDLMVGVLEDEPHPPGVAAERPGGRFQQPGEMLRQGGLARSVAAQQRDELAAVDGDADPVEGQHPRRVAVGQADGLQDGGSLRFGSFRHPAAVLVAGADSRRRDPLLVVEERTGRAEIREFPLLQHQEQIRPGGHGIRVVVDHDHGASRSAQVRDDAPHRRRPLRVEGRGGFVGDQQIRAQ